MGEKLKIGEIKATKAEICIKLKCTLFLKNKYPQCQVKAAIQTDDCSTSVAKPRVISVYRAAIPDNCALGYDVDHPSYESANTYRGRDNGTW